MTARHTKAAGDAQKQVDDEQDKGYRGDKVDPLPNSHYTFPGPSGAETEAPEAEGDSNE